MKHILEEVGRKQMNSVIHTFFTIIIHTLDYSNAKMYCIYEKDFLQRGNSYKCVFCVMVNSSIISRKVHCKCGRREQVRLIAFVL